MPALRLTADASRLSTQAKSADFFPRDSDAAFTEHAGACRAPRLFVPHHLAGFTEAGSPSHPPRRTGHTTPDIARCCFCLNVFWDLAGPRLRNSNGSNVSIRWCRSRANARSLRAPFERVLPGQARGLRRRSGAHEAARCDPPPAPVPGLPLCHSSCRLDKSITWGAR